MRDGLDQPGGRGHDGLRRAVCRAAKKKDHTAPMARAERHGQREREMEREREAERQRDSRWDMAPGTPILRLPLPSPSPWPCDSLMPTKHDAGWLDGQVLVGMRLSPDPGLRHDKRQTCGGVLLSWARTKGQEQRGAGEEV